MLTNKLRGRESERLNFCHKTTRMRARKLSPAPRRTDEVGVLRQAFSLDYAPGARAARRRNSVAGHQNSPVVFAMQST
jgi:hypothetical protein